MALLIGDVGGTNTRLAIEGTNDPRTPVRFRNADHPTFEAVLDDFLARQGTPTIDAAVLAVAGPVVDGAAQMTNLPWHLDARAIGARVGSERIRLLNDLEAAAYAVPHLAASCVHTLTPDVAPRRGTVGLVVPGTGLGEALLLFDGDHHHPMASEGGHADFAPHTDDDVALLEYIRATGDPHVSWEDVLSGPGLVRLTRFLMDTGRAPVPREAEGWFRAPDPAAAITASAIANGPPLARTTLDIWMRLLGAELGNLALKGLTLGGAFLAGTIIDAIRPALAAGPLVAAFRAKGRHAPLMNTMAVGVVTEPDLPLVGARHFARRLVHVMQVG